MGCAVESDLGRPIASGVSWAVDLGKISSVVLTIRWYHGWSGGWTRIWVKFGKSLSEKSFSLFRLSMECLVACNIDELFSDRTAGKWFPKRLNSRSSVRDTYTVKGQRRFTYQSFWTMSFFSSCSEYSIRWSSTCAVIGTLSVRSSVPEPVRDREIMETSRTVSKCLISWHKEVL